MAFDPISIALEIGGKVLDRIIPDPAQKAAAQIELLKMAQAGELAQIDVNKAEAASGSAYAAGWRPTIGYICAAALAYQYVVAPLGMALWVLTGHPAVEIPKLDDTLWQLLAGMLGLSGLRSFEKIKGVT